MTELLARQIEKLKTAVLTLGAEVEESVRLALKAFEEHDEPLARKVVAGDAHIDEMEVDLEEECLKILSLYQPQGASLRFIVATLKITSDLERIGDLAVNIAQRILYLEAGEEMELPQAFYEMADTARLMLKSCLDSLVNRDAALAHQVCAWDQRVDDRHRQLIPDTERKLREQPERANAHLKVLTVCRFIERIADHATNIAEDVLYMLKGEIVRHRLGDE